MALKNVPTVLTKKVALNQKYPLHHQAAPRDGTSDHINLINLINLQNNHWWVSFEFYCIFFWLWHYFIGISSDAQSTNVQMKTFASVQRNVATAGGSVAMATMNTVAHVSSSPSSFVWKMIENRFSLQFAEPETRCGADEFKCDEHICLPNSKKCDRNRDCRDGTDESDCRKYFSEKKVKFANFVCSMKSVTKNNVFKATDYRTKNGFFSLKMLLL